MEMFGMRSESEMLPTAYWKYEVISKIKRMIQDTNISWLKTLLMKI